MIRLGLLILLFQAGFIYLNSYKSPDKSEDTNNKPQKVNNTGAYKVSHPISHTYSKDIDPRIRAFLDLIAYAEGTSGVNGYRMQYTGKYFTSFAKHPEEVICAMAYNGKLLCSTAAGRYQMLSTTWFETAKKGGMTDFSPSSQDKGAVILLRDKGTIFYLTRRSRPSEEDIRMAINSSNGIWASLPGSPYGQPTKGMKESINRYYFYLDRYTGPSIRKNK